MTADVATTVLDDALARAALAWPGVTVARDRFAEFIAGRDDLRADLVLACACLDGQPAALALFEERLFAPVAARLRATMGASVAEETIGRLRESLFLGDSPKLATYSGRGDLRGWLEVVATREAYKVARKEPAPGDDHILASLPDDDDLELRHIKAQHRAELSRAFGEALGSLPPRERLLLRQRYLDSLTFDEVAALHGVHRITVMRWFARIEKALLREIQRLLVARLGLPTAEVEHLVDDARSRLDISLRGLLSVAVAFVLATGGVAHADKARSLEHYAKGKKAYAAASFEAAIAEFEAAYREQPAPEYLHDIAQAYRRLDRACEAVAYFERYLAAKPAAKNKADVEGHVATLKPRCAPPAPPSASSSSSPAGAPAAASVSGSANASPVSGTQGTPRTAASVSGSANASPASPSGTQGTSPRTGSANASPASPRTAAASVSGSLPDASVSVAGGARQPRSPYSIAASGGIALLDAGPVVMPPVAQLEVALRRRLSPIVHVGAGLSLARLPYDDMASGTSWLAGPQLTVDGAYPLARGVSLAGGAALGAIAITGLGAGNPFVDGGMATGTIVTARLRGELGVAWQASDRVTVRVLPLAYQWSPARGKLASDIDALHGYAASAGVAVGW